MRLQCQEYIVYCHISLFVCSVLGWVLGLTSEPIDKLQGLHSSAHNLSQEAKQKILLLR